MSSPEATKDTPIIVTPSPLDMPGAQNTIPAIVNPEARSLEIAEAKTAEQPAPVTTDSLAADERNELERLRAIHKDEQKWEKRAKQNFEKASTLDTITQALGTPNADEPVDPVAEVAKIRKELEDERTERVREKVANATGVPVSQIHGSDEGSMTASADEALTWAKEFIKQAGVPLAAPAATVTSTDVPTKPQQIQSREDLKTMTPQQILEADRTGRLDFLKGKA